MFPKKTPAESRKLDAVIEKMFDSLLEETPGTKEFTHLTEQLNSLYEAKQTDTKLKLETIETLSKQELAEAETRLKELEIELKTLEVGSFNKVKPETLIALVANLGGILAIIKYEQFHALTTKALGFVKKLSW